MAGPIPANLLCSADDLVTLPDVARRLAQLAADPVADGESIGRLASWDPALTARLLSQANDARWGQTGLVASASRALAVLDNPALRKLPSGLRTAQTFDGVPRQLASMESFWQTSVHVAVAAREIAMRGGKGRPDIAFNAGLLHDIGQLVLLERRPGEFRTAIEQSNRVHPSAPDLDHCEREQFSFDHARVGGALLAAWRLPNALKTCVAFHHQPERARHFRSEVAIVNAANSLAALALRGSEDFRDAPAVARGTWDRCGLTPDEGLAAIAGVHRQAQEARRLFAS